MQWSRFFVYYKDIDLVFKKAEDAVTVVEIDDEYTYMLAMAPWHYTDPLGPFLTKKIGFNIMVPQPIEAEYPVQYYSLISGWKIMAEQELRDYVVYELEEPQPPSEGFEVDCSLESKHYTRGTPGSIRLGVISASADEFIASIEIDGKVLTSEKFSLSEGSNNLRLGFDTGSLDSGRIQLRLNFAATNFDVSFDQEILVIDNEKISKIREKVSELGKQRADDLKIKESLVTIEWMLESLEGKIVSLKPHQAPWLVQDLIDRLENDMKKIESGESLFVKGEQLRLVLRSKQDGTLQPYSMYIPPTYEEGTSGLIVILHGSGTNDERSLKHAEPLDKFDGTKMIIVAPFARGESHQYLPEESIQEIIEVTEND